MNWDSSSSKYCTPRHDKASRVWLNDKPWQMRTFLWTGFALRTLDKSSLCITLDFQPETCIIAAAGPLYQEFCLVKIVSEK